MLVFARIGTMVMLLPGLGELSVPVRVRLTVALVLDRGAAAAAPHRLSARSARVRAGADACSAQEMLIGAVLGLTARLTISALQVAGSVIAQQLGLGFVTAVDPTQGQQGVIVGNFLTMLGITLIFATDLHHLVIAALNDSYTLFRPGEIPLLGDVAALLTDDRRAALPHRHAALGAVPGVRPAVQSRARRAVAADAADAGVLRRPAAVDPDRLPDPAAGGRRDDDDLPRLRRRRAARSSRRIREARAHGRTNSDDTERSEDPTQKRLDEALERGDVAKSQEVNTWFVIAGGDAGADGVLRLDGRAASATTLRGLHRQFATRFRVDGRGLLGDRRDASASRCSPRSRSRSLLLVLAAIAGNMIQHRLVWSARAAEAEALARFRRSPGSSGCSPSRRWPISSRAWSSSR